MATFWINLIVERGYYVLLKPCVVDARQELCDNLCWDVMAFKAESDGFHQFLLKIRYPTDSNICFYRI